MEAVKAPLRLLEIEKELAGDGRMEAMARYDATLAALEERIAETLRGGVAPDDFAKITALREANIIARKILRLTVRVDGQE